MGNEDREEGRMASPGVAKAKEPVDRRRLAEETMASWALEGMEPSPEAISRIRAFVNNELTRDEFIAAAKAARQ